MVMPSLGRETMIVDCDWLRRASRSGSAHGEDQVGHVRTSDEDLIAVDDPGVADILRERRQRPENVGAPARLGEGHRGTQQTLRQGGRYYPPYCPDC